MINVRKADFTDLERCTELSKEFWYQLDFSKQIPFVDRDVYDMFTLCHKANLVAIAEDDDELVGVVAGAIGPCMANFELKFGAELIWYVKRGYRDTGVGKMLLEQIEQQAKDEGIVRWSMMVFDQHNPDIGINALESSGYSAAERIFTKVF